jgi:hypothetical protein
MKIPCGYLRIDPGVRWGAAKLEALERPARRVTIEKSQNALAVHPTSVKRKNSTKTTSVGTYLAGHDARVR